MRKIVWFGALHLIGLLTACGGNQSIEDTRIVSQTVVVTQIVEATAVPTKSTELPNPAQCIQDVAYYDGIVTITRYATLFEQGAFEDAYQLLSPSASHHPSFDDYVNNSRALAITTFEVVRIQPYYEWAKQQGSVIQKDTETRKVFYVQILSEGQGGMAGSVENGIHTYFVTVVYENEKWLILSFDTAPSP